MSHDGLPFGPRIVDTTIARHKLRLLAVMSQGVPGELAETWQLYTTLHDARMGALTALQDARVLCVAIVDDRDSALRLVEWMPSYPGMITNVDSRC